MCLLIHFSAQSLLRGLPTPFSDRRSWSSGSGCSPLGCVCVTLRLRCRAGDVCGSGFNPRKHGKVCQLHTSLISGESLLSYWQQLPQEHREMLFSLPRHDFEAELDSCCTCGPSPPSPPST